MKILLFVSIVILFGCKAKSQKDSSAPAVKEVTHAVFNKCTGLWAVIIADNDRFRTSAWSGYFGFYNEDRHILIGGKMDSIEFAPLGMEYTFKDSSVAMDVYSKWYIKTRKSAEIQKQKEKVQDSIFKCQHTYQ